MSSFWSKRIKNKNNVAKEMGVDKEKIQELIEGKRQIEGKTMDKVLEIIEDEKINRPIKNLEILQWYRDTDLVKLREKFGYNSQLELSKKLGINNGTLCRFEHKKYNLEKVTGALEKLYNFYQNDFNKKINKITGKEIFEWYKKIDDFGEYRRKFGYSKNKLMSELNLSYDQSRDLERKSYKKANSIVKKAYEFFHNEDNRLPEVEWIKPEKELNIVVDKESEIIKEEPKENNKVITNEISDNIVETLRIENTRLRLQIERYEKLIDRL